MEKGCRKNASLKARLGPAQQARAVQGVWLLLCQGCEVRPEIGFCLVGLVRRVVLDKP